MWEMIKYRVSNLFKAITSKRTVSAAGVISLVMTTGDSVAKICVTVISITLIVALTYKETQKGD